MKISDIPGINLFAIKTSHYVLAGMSLVVALSWNTTIKELINHIYPMKEGVFKANLLYSIIITALLVILILFLPDTKDELPHETRIKLHKTELDNYKKEIEKFAPGRF